ncbi:restriction endonuclease subunit S [Bradyrhizobium sp. HKCCYLS1011]|uniref:restriction endonuclease subunit S n=1 Tax=Bradyrhizobium sp. HKCCYLS1011 TaxID=3420733 RepID=UPI003EBB1121
MIDGLHPYGALKPTGVDWLPSLPEGWEVHRAKYSFKEVDDRSETGAEELLSVSHKTGVTPRSQKNITMFMAESYEGHKVCRPDDIVVNTMWAWMAAVGVSRHVGIVSPAYAVYRPRTADRFESKYLDFLLRTEVYRAEFLRSSRGITTSRLRLYPPDFLNIPIVQPPLEEQRLIVRFLDWHGAQTAKLIRAKKKIVALLNERKRAIIHHAVTRGLDPNPKLKPTSIPWIGDIPQDWSVSRVKTEFQCLNYRRIPLSGTERGKMTRRLYDYYGASGIIDKVDDYLFDDKLLLIAEDGANLVLRNLPLAIVAEGKFWVNNHAHILKPRRGDIRFLAAVLEGLNFLPWISGAAQPKLTQDRLMGIAIAIPPPHEQRGIIDSCETSTSGLTRWIGAATNEISLIQEFRARLVSDVVTGKLDVRALAASLPDTIDEEPVDDVAENDDDLDEGIEGPEGEEIAA